MNNEEKKENKVNCKLCGEEIDNPVVDTRLIPMLNMTLFHFTRYHVKEIREFLKTKTLADILGTDEGSLYPIYLEFYPDGDLITASLEIEDLLYKFVVSNISVRSTLEASE
jgi:hypothetical protein